MISVAQVADKHLRRHKKQQEYRRKANRFGPDAHYQYHATTSQTSILPVESRRKPLHSCFVFMAMQTVGGSFNERPEQSCTQS